MTFPDKLHSGLAFRWIDGRIEKVGWTRDTWLTCEPISIGHAPIDLAKTIATAIAAAIVWHKHTLRYTTSEGRGGYRFNPGGITVDLYLPSGACVTQEHVDAVERALR